MAARITTRNHGATRCSPRSHVAFGMGRSTPDVRAPLSKRQRLTRDGSPLDAMSRPSSPQTTAVEETPLNVSWDEVLVVVCPASAPQIVAVTGATATAATTAVVAAVDAVDAAAANTDVSTADTAVSAVSATTADIAGATDTDAGITDTEEDNHGTMPRRCVCGTKYFPNGCSCRVMNSDGTMFAGEDY